MSLSRKLVFLPNKARLGVILGISFVGLIFYGYLNLQSAFESLSQRCALAGIPNLGNGISGFSHLLQKPEVSPEDDVIVIYNRVPKTGSTSFVEVAYGLCEQNKFNAIHLNISKNSHVLSLSDQIRFVTNLTNWNEKKPAFYHGHIAYLNFQRFGIAKTPIYINVLREPLDRLVSYYYFLRNGDDFRPHIKRRKAGNQETFDECVIRDGHDCSPDHLWLQIPFFCGHSAECWSVGSEWALEMAKHNLMNNYLLVGVTDELKDFVAVLELTLPRYFSGALNHFTAGNRSHLRKTYNRIEPSPETIEKIQHSTVWKMENEFYLFAKEQFLYVKEKTLSNSDSSSMVESKNFWFEKIRP